MAGGLKAVQAEPVEELEPAGEGGPLRQPLLFLPPVLAPLLHQAPAQQAELWLGLPCAGAARYQGCGSGSLKCRILFTLIAKIRNQLFTLMRIRIGIRILTKVMGIFDYYFINPSELYFEPPGLRCERPRPSTPLF